MRRRERGRICNKSCDNIYRFNTFAAGTRELSVRHGNRCQVYGNFFIGSEGIRFFGHDHRIYSNYFTKCKPAISVGNGDGVVPPAALTAHDRPEGVQVVFNTLVDNQVNVIMAGRNRGLGANSFTFANNIVQGGNKAVAISGPLKDPVWEGNLLWANQGGAGDIPAAGFTALDPQLKQTGDGLFHLQPGSPAIGRAAGSYPYVDVNIDGQPRGAAKDAGADQFSQAPVVNRVLAPADVGPDVREKTRTLPTFAKPCSNRSAAPPARSARLATTLRRAGQQCGKRGRANDRRQPLRGICGVRGQLRHGVF